MAWVFCVGLFIGLPIGCHLRQQGYKTKAVRAYRTVIPIQEQSAEQETAINANVLSDNHNEK